MMMESYVVCVFEDGDKFKGFWAELDDADGGGTVDEETEASWFGDLELCTESLGLIPRAIDARIYRLVPVPAK
jgi:hypothetical protein